METINFNLQTNLKFGANTFTKLGNYIKGKDTCFIVDKNARNDYINSVLDTLEGSILEYNFGEPTYDLLEKYRYLYEADTYVGIGGGSVMDFAKGLAFLQNNPLDALEYRGFPTNTNPPQDIITVPTTPGTGAEVTYNAVFIDTGSKKKLGINTLLNYPKLTILDPKVVAGVPFEVIRSSVLDCLVHSIESYVARQSNQITRVFSKQAFDLLVKRLSFLKESHHDLDYYADLQLASYYAGIALMNSGSGPAGALSYVLGTHFNVPHGLAGATFLPHIIEHNEDKDKFIYDDLNDYIPLEATVVDILEQCDVDYTNLRQFGVNEKNVDILLKEIERLQPAFNQNPVPFTVNDAKRIIRDMI